MTKGTRSLRNGEEQILSPMKAKLNRIMIVIASHEISYQWMKRVKDNVILIVNDARRKKYTINEFRPAFGQLGGYDLYEKLTPFMLALALFHVGEFVLCLRGSYQISIKIL